MLFSLPVNVMWISKIKYEHQILKKHTHDFYHMFYIKKGKGIMHIDENDYDICENEVYLCPPGTYHGMTAEEDIPVNVIEAKFTVSDANLQKLIFDMQKRIKCYTCDFYIKLEELMREAFFKSSLHKEIIDTGFTKLLLELARLAKNEDYSCSATVSSNFINNSIDTIKDSAGCSVVLKNVLDYINNNYSEDITLKQLAQVGAVSPGYLNKIFKEAFNMSPMKYINHFRLDKAKELMMYSDFNISQISELVGFTSIHYFSRYFKKKENMTPSEYRENVKDNIYIYL
ncbi:MAG TPA: helix-turn-helix transcriptional regulator [Clostridiaceae bacterium]|nr:helix-turn-helix transcriptional regulator [Clostridiaceae bacterium]